MTKTFTSNNSGEVGLLKGMLEEAGIACLIRDETQPYQAVFQPELWVLNDADVEKAVGLREAWRHPGPASREPWTCPKCGEVMEGQFVACWKCQTERKAGV